MPSGTFHIEKNVRKLLMKLSCSNNTFLSAQGLLMHHYIHKNNRNKNKSEKQHNGYMLDFCMHHLVMAVHSKKSLHCFNMKEIFCNYFYRCFKCMFKICMALHFLKHKVISLHLTANTSVISC